MAAYEISNHEIRPGLWAKAFSETHGDEQHASTLYIQLRVEQIKLGVDVTAEIISNLERHLINNPVQIKPLELPPAKPKELCRHCKKELSGDQCGCEGTFFLPTRRCKKCGSQWYSKGPHGGRQADICNGCGQWLYSDNVKLGEQ